MKMPPSLYPSPSTGEGGVGVIFIPRCARPGHGDSLRRALVEPSGTIASLAASTFRRSSTGQAQSWTPQAVSRWPEGVPPVFILEAAQRGEHCRILTTCRGYREVPKRDVGVCRLHCRRLPSLPVRPGHQAEGSDQPIRRALRYTRHLPDPAYRHRSGGSTRRTRNGKTYDRCRAARAGERVAVVCLI